MLSKHLWTSSSSTSGMMWWLNRDYKLSSSEAALVVGFARTQDVADLVRTQVSVVAKASTMVLSTLEKLK